MNLVKRQTPSESETLGKTWGMSLGRLTQLYTCPTPEASLRPRSPSCNKLRFCTPPGLETELCVSATITRIFQLECWASQNRRNWTRPMMAKQWGSTNLRTNTINMSTVSVPSTDSNWVVDTGYFATFRSMYEYVREEAIRVASGKGDQQQSLVQGDWARANCSVTHPWLCASWSTDDSCVMRN